MTKLPSFRLVHDQARQLATAAVWRAIDGWWCDLRPPQRSKDQNRLLHSALSDIAKQLPWHGEKLSVTVWKRLCTAAWLRERGGKPLLVPALDGDGVDVIYEPTSELSVSECADLIVWVHGFGGQNNVKFTY